MQPIDIIAHKLQPALAECALHNQTAHEYPAHPELVLANLQQLLNHVPMLEQAHQQLSRAAAKAMASKSPPNESEPGSFSPCA